MKLKTKKSNFLFQNNSFVYSSYVALTEISVDIAYIR